MKNGGQGSPRGQQLQPCAPLRMHQLASSGLPIGHTEYLIDTHNQLLLLTPYLTHPPQTNTTMYPGLIEIQKRASTPQA